GDLENLDGGQLKVIRDGRHDLRREVAVILVLRRVQRADDRRALPARRKLRDPAVDLLAHVRGEHGGRRAGGGIAHRSISPKTMSCVPMTATTSASIWP